MRLLQNFSAIFLTHFPRGFELKLGEVMKGRGEELHAAAGALGGLKEEMKMGSHHWVWFL